MKENAVIITIVAAVLEFLNQTLSNYLTCICTYSNRPLCSILKDIIEIEEVMGFYLKLLEQLFMEKSVLCVENNH